MQLPFKSKGYHSAQVPRDLTWLDVTCKNLPPRTELHVMAKDESGNSIVTNFVTPSFSSLFISHMPEYCAPTTSQQNAQFLYNCLLLLAFQTFTRTLEEQCISQLVAILPALKKEDVLRLNRDVQERVLTVLKHDPIMVRLLRITRKGGKKRPKPNDDEEGEETNEKEQEE